MVSSAVEDLALPHISILAYLLAVRVAGPDLARLMRSKRHASTTLRDLHVSVIIFDGPLGLARDGDPEQLTGLLGHLDFSFVSLVDN